MTNEYLAGFFDADGYISAIKDRKNEERKITCGFTNTDALTLQIMKTFIEKEFSIKMSVHKKKSKKENHKIGYDLRVTGPNAVKLLNRLPIIHPKKVKRLVIANEIQKCTPRNGKYSESEIQHRRDLCDKLLNTM